MASRADAILLLPGLAVVGALLLVPFGWMLGLSFVEDGGLSLPRSRSCSPS